MGARLLHRASVLFWVWHIERSEWLLNADVDPLVNAMVSKGPQRSRRLDRDLKRAVASEIGKGTVGRTAGTFSKAYSLCRRHRAGRINRWAAQTAQRKEVWRYWKSGQAPFGGASHIPVAFDGTTIAGKEMMCAAMYAPCLGRAIWCPPQVGCINRMYNHAQQEAK